MAGTGEFMRWVEEISKVSFGPLVALLLFGNFLGIWVWGRLHRERIAELKAELAEEKAEKLEWKTMALGLLTPVESAMNRTKARG